MNYFFSFLKQINPKAEELGEKVQDRYFEDPESALLNSRKMIEAIVNNWLDIKGLQNTYNLNENIKLLQQEEIIDRTVASELHFIRKNGNSAAHESFTKESHQVLPQIWSALHTIIDSYILEFENPPEMPKYAPPKPFSKNDFGNHDDLLDVLESRLMAKLRSNESADEAANQSDTESFEESKVLYNYLAPVENPDESYLYNLFSRLNESSKEAVESAELPLSPLKQYLHVERPIEKKLVELLSKPEQKRLILLVGSVGDGKSHILSNLQSVEPELMKRYKDKVWNDATESLSPHKTAMETLFEKLLPFSDQLLQSGDEEFVLAINLGVLHKFLYDYLKTTPNEYSFEALISYIESSGIFDNEISSPLNHESFSMVSFSDYPMYELTRNGTESDFLMRVLDKIFSRNEENPFYLAYTEDKNNNIDSIVHRNYLLMTNENIRRNFVMLLSHALLKEKTVLSMRQFFNLIYEMIVPGKWSQISKQNVLLESLLMHGVHQKIFMSSNDSSIAEILRREDPVLQRSEKVDQLILKLTLESNVDEIVSKFDPITKEAYELEMLDVERAHNYTQALLRLLYLSNPIELSISQQSIEEYSKYLYSYYTGHRNDLKDLYTIFKNALMLWFGYEKDKKMYLFDTSSKVSKRYRIAKPVLFKLQPISKSQTNAEKINQFRNSLLIQFAVGENQKEVKLEIDYKMFELISKIDQGYQPSKLDFDDAIRFSEFANAIRTYNNNNDEVLVYVIQTGEAFILKQETDPFSDEEKVTFSKL